VDFPVIQYANDTLVIMPVDNAQLRIMGDILEQYAQSTSLKINFHKSSLVPINIADATGSAIVDSLVCKVSSMPFIYLGIPLGTTKPTV
jgi:hypothetical protein